MTGEAQTRILVIKLGALGDFIQALGAMAAIRAHHKDSRITLLTTKTYAPLAQACGYFDDIMIDQKPRLTELKKWMQLCLDLNKAGFTRVYDLQNNDRTNLYFKLFSIKNRPQWVGTAKGASHRNTSTTRTAGHAFDGHAQTLALAGITTVQIDRLEWMKATLAAFPLKNPYVLLIPGSAPTRLEKRWPAERYARLAALLNSLGYQPVILGTPSEAPLAAKIMALCPQAIDLCGQTDLLQIATLGREAAAAIGNDTGPMHLIAATACPCIALFSSASNPVRHAPKGDYVQIIFKESLEGLSAEEVIGAFRPRQTPAFASLTQH